MLCVRSLFVRLVYLPVNDLVVPLLFSSWGSGEVGGHALWFAGPRHTHASHSAAEQIRHPGTSVQALEVEEEEEREVQTDLSWWEQKKKTHIHYPPLLLLRLCAVICSSHLPERREINVSLCWIRQQQQQRWWTAAQSCRAGGWCTAAAHVWSVWLWSEKASETSGGQLLLTLLLHLQDSERLILLLTGRFGDLISVKWVWVSHQVLSELQLQKWLLWINMTFLTAVH